MPPAGIQLQFFGISISGIKRAQTAVSPPVQMNADLLTSARALFSLARYRLNRLPLLIVGISRLAARQVTRRHLLAPLASLLVPVPLLDLGHRTRVAWSWLPHSRRQRRRRLRRRRCIFRFRFDFSLPCRGHLVTEPASVPPNRTQETN